MEYALAPHPRPTIDAVMRAFVADLAEAGVPNPLGQELTFAALWDDLCHLAGEEAPAFVRRLLDDADADTPLRIAPPTDAGPVTAVCLRLLAELRARRVDRPLARQIAVGLFWADLCRLAGEAPPALVRALLATPVRC